MSSHLTLQNRIKKAQKKFFSPLEHLDKQPRKDLFLLKKRGGGGTSKRLGRAQTKSGLLPMGSHSSHAYSASSMTQYRKMFANRSFVVHVQINETQKLRLLVVGNSSIILEGFLLFQGDKKNPDDPFP